LIKIGRNKEALNFFDIAEKTIGQLLEKDAVEKEEDV
jgi:hypothetical protein